MSELCARHSREDEVPKLIIDEATMQMLAGRLEG
jgi:hypothetical protein